MYLLVSRAGSRAGIGRLEGYTTSSPTFTLLHDLPGAQAGYALHYRGIAYDPGTGNLVINGGDGYTEMFFSYDLATRSLAALFDDLAIAQLRGLDIGDDGIGYGRHLWDQWLQRIDVAGATVTPVFDTGGATGFALTVTHDGRVLAIDSTTMLRSIVLATGLVRELGLTYFWHASGMDMTSDGRLIALSNSGQVLEIDPETGALSYLAFVPALSSGVIGITIVAPQPLGWRASCVTDTA